jgi:hypothetical protein
MDQITQALALLEALGITLPSWAFIIGATLFSFIGIFVYWYAKKASLPTTKWIGVALMLYPYVVWETWLMYVVGVGLCAAGLYFSSHKR